MAQSCIRIVEIISRRSLIETTSGPTLGIRTLVSSHVDAVEPTITYATNGYIISNDTIIRCCCYYAYAAEWWCCRAVNKSTVGQVD